MSLAHLPLPAAVIFDLDGTLVDTVQYRIDAWRGAFDEAGIESDEDQVGALIGADGRRLAREVAAVAGVDLDADGAERLDQVAGRRFSELAGHPDPHPGAAELLSELDEADVRWAIATSSRPEQVQASVAVLGLSHDPRIIDGSHVEEAKPAPDILFESARQLELDPAECWYIGDATWDMLAARAAGMTAIGVATGAASQADLTEAGAHVTFPGFPALREAMVQQGLIGGLGSPTSAEGAEAEAEIAAEIEAEAKATAPGS
jgi:HAD superfamily hydrolase (TIGR01509 family)